MTNRTSSHYKQSAFTLVEIMVVVMIISTLIGLGVPRYRQARIKTQVAVYLADRKVLADALEIYRLRNNGDDPPAAPANQIHSQLYPYIDQKFQGVQPKNPFGGIWYTQDEQNGGSADQLVNPETFTFVIIATTPSPDYANEIGKYLPKDGRTYVSEESIWYCL